MPSFKNPSKRKKSHVTRHMREMKKREPQLVEVVKNTLVIRGQKTSEPLMELLRDLYSIQKPAAKLFSRKNPLRPFEDTSSLEFLCERNDCGLFAFGSHSKKRPHNLILGRMFDTHLLDMVEMGVEAYTPIAGLQSKKPGIGTKPCMMFMGNEFEHDDTFMRIKNLLVDFFRGRVVDSLHLPSLDHVMVASVNNGKLLIRFYSLKFKKSGIKTPAVVLEDMGPNIDLTIRRTHFAAAELAKAARKQPKQNRQRKQKNVSTAAGLGDKVGRLHMVRQDYGELQTRKVKGLKKRNTPAGAEAVDSASPSISGGGAGGGAGAGAGAGAGTSSGSQSARSTKRQRRAR